jgi:S1-C subfamily serine protease
LPLKVKDIDLKKGAYIFKGDEVSDAIARKSPAQKAGLRGGDIILSVMGDEINENYNLAERLLEYSAGDKVDLEILRNGEKMELSVELGEQK